MEVSHQKANGSWRLNRFFDEYRRFQKKLVKLLSHGHFCNAECPWLYTFIKSYFPKNLFLTYRFTKVLTLRREALTYFFQTIQKFLLNHENYTCSIISFVIAKEFITFVYGDLPGGMPHPAVSKLLMSPSSKNSTFDSDASTSDDDDIQHTSDPNDSSILSFSFSSTDQESTHLCQLCQCLLAVETNCQVRNTTKSNSRHNKKLHHTAAHPYATRLCCGHEFHDECIIPRLNEALVCPICGKSCYKLS
jgi:hypothetical protein